ncbi:hypothetical protein CYMTET_52510 [Cymbomonas tetramitiformis]|uniref:Uncharacterized protein n=1 Tax=Cymbomonas tetramitiformis TaxID=36881 RepID=A0AAE0ESN6_9CHLO|nr:hypothetical protein CYMTET_52510 [Cymbomonas tetramitiformis]
MAERGRVSPNADEAGPSGTANVSETAELATEEVPTHAPYQYNLCAGFGVEDILSSVTMTTPVMNVTPPRQQAEYFVPGAEAQARAATTEAQAVTPETVVPAVNSGSTSLLKAAPEELANIVFAMLRSKGAKLYVFYFHKEF